MSSFTSLFSRRIVMASIYSHSYLDSVIRYIRNWEKYHAKRSLRNGYLTLLKRFDIAYKPKYVFEFFTDE